MTPDLLNWRIVKHHGISIQAPTSSPYGEVTWPVARVNLWPWPKAVSFYHARLIVAAPRLLALVRKALAGDVGPDWRTAAAEILNFIDEGEPDLFDESRQG